MLQFREMPTGYSHLLVNLWLKLWNTELVNILNFYDFVLLEFVTSQIYIRQYRWQAPSQLLIISSDYVCTILVQFSLLVAYLVFSKLFYSNSLNVLDSLHYTEVVNVNLSNHQLYPSHFQCKLFSGFILHENFMKL